MPPSRPCTTRASTRRSSRNTSAIWTSTTTDPRAPVDVLQRPGRLKTGDWRELLPESDRGRSFGPARLWPIVAAWHLGHPQTVSARASGEHGAGAARRGGQAVAAEAVESAGDLLHNADPWRARPGVDVADFLQPARLAQRPDRGHGLALHGNRPVCGRHRHSRFYLRGVFHRD